jgi:hypothetical protein
MTTYATLFSFFVRKRLGLTALLAALILLFVPAQARSDTVTMNDGEVLDGIIESIDEGQVTIRIDGEAQQLSIRDIDNIDFNTPHLPDLVDNDELAHYLGDTDAQEMVRHVQELRQTAAEIDALIATLRAEWEPRNPIQPDEVPEWEAAKEAVRRPISRYQEVLADLYYHIVADVDEYYRMVNEGSDVYVGVEGVFRVGSSLVPQELRQLPLQSFMPPNWYDAIYFEGYYVGYDDAYRELEPELDSDQ